MKIRFDYVFAIYIAFALAVIVRCLRTVWHGLTGTGPTWSAPAAAEAHDYD